MEYDKKIKIFEEFLKWKPSLVHLMRNCYHSFSIDDVNKYHMEDDVWSHTCMTYNQFLYSDAIQSLFKNDFTALCAAISILTHDIGKVYTRSTDIEGKVKMYGHTFASVQDSIDFIYYLEKKQLLIPYNLNDVLETVLLTVGNHIDFFRVDNKKRWLLCNGNLNTAYTSSILALCDQRGRIHESHEKFIERSTSLYGFMYNLSYMEEFPKIDIEDCDVIFMSGPPGIGKSTYVENLKEYINISIDDIFVEEFKKSEEYDAFWGDVYTSKELYEKAFMYQKKKKYGYNNIFLKKIKTELEFGNKVVLSNTNPTKKRKKRINAINGGKEKRYKFGCIYFCLESDELEKRNRKRTDKSIDNKTLNRFKYSQVPASIDEGFDTVIYVYNS